MKIAAVLAMGLGLATTASKAQQQNQIDLILARWAGTTMVRYSPTFSNGQLVGCGIEFNALVREFAFRKGEYDKISGSFGFMLARSKVVAPMLKIVVEEIDRRDLSSTPNPPKKAYVTSGNESNFKALISSYNSDTPGALFSVFNIEPTAEMYFKALSEGKIDIRYGKSESGIDIPLSIDLTVTETKDDGQRVHSDKHIDDTLACVKDLMGSAK